MCLFTVFRSLRDCCPSPRHIFPGRAMGVVISHHAGTSRAISAGPVLRFLLGAGRGRRHGSD